MEFIEGISLLMLSHFIIGRIWKSNVYALGFGMIAGHIICMVAGIAK